jgi:hypothetical protein
VLQQEDSPVLQQAFAEVMQELFAEGVPECIRRRSPSVAAAMMAIVRHLQRLQAVDQLASSAALVSPYEVQCSQPVKYCTVGASCIKEMRSSRCLASRLGLCCPLDSRYGIYCRLLLTMVRYM